MADFAIRLVVSKLDALITKECKLLGGVQQSIKDAQDELESMVQAVREADARGESNKVWVKQIREAVYDIEDVIDEFLLHIGQTHGRGFVADIRRILHIGKNVTDYHYIGKDLEELEDRVCKISDRSIRYPTVPPAQASPGDGHHWSSFPVNETEMVGLDKPGKKITGWLLSGDLCRLTVAVHGMGGVGKSTLADQVYGDAISDKVKYIFDCHAWLSLANGSKSHELLESLMKQIHESSGAQIPEGLSGRTQPQLIKSVKDFIATKRYIVVLDNLFSTDQWKSLSSALPDNGMGSRVLVTTRMESVALKCAKSADHVYHLEPLDKSYSWSLFCKTAFPHAQCPEDLRPLSWKIVDKCAGIPLAITLIAGLLPKLERERTTVKWQEFYNRLPYLLAKNEDLKKMGKVLIMGYNELPYYLKPCFLYLTLFPKSRRIKCARLIRLWIAEGFIEQEEDMRLEDIAEAYLNELINRNMVNVAKFDACGRPRSCQVHDLLWDNILKRAQEENFCSCLDTHVATIPKRMRRLSIRTSVTGVQPAKDDFSHIRSLLLFDRQEFSTKKFFTNSFRLLKVLDLKGSAIQEFPEQVVELLHLRYLSLRRTDVSMLPKTIGKLRNLETLDLKDTLVCSLPDEIARLHNLRHLLVYQYIRGQPSLSSPSKQGANAGILVNPNGLQKLCYLDMAKMGGRLRELGELVQLRRIGVTGLRGEDCLDLCSAIKSMNELRSIDIRSARGHPLDLHSLRSPLPMLQRISLHGNQMELPSLVTKARNLVKLNLSGSKLQHDPFESLQHLGNLMELHLVHAYEGTELSCGKKGFKKLKVLEVHHMANLQVVRVGQGAMPVLHKLTFQRCDSLHRMPIDFQHLFDLKEYFVDGTAIKFFKEHSRIEQPHKEDHLRVHVDKKLRIPLPGSRYSVLMECEGVY